jgi:hypothetical protein
MVHLWDVAHLNDEYFVEEVVNASRAFAKQTNG